jgi:hypothetical protein
LAKKIQQNSVDAMPPHIEAMLRKFPAMAEAARYGVDIPMLLDNLKLSISQRIEQLQAAVDLADKLKDAQNL